MDLEDFANLLGSMARGKADSEDVERILRPLRFFAQGGVGGGASFTPASEGTTQFHSKFDLLKGYSGDKRKWGHFLEFRIHKPCKLSH